MNANKIETRCNTMRHVATLDVCHSHRREESASGNALASDIEMVLDFAEHMTKEELVKRIAQDLATYHGRIAEAKARMQRSGQKVDAMTFADEQQEQPA